MAAEDEAAELIAAADGDATRLDALVARRLAGEPLAWITGTTSFAGLDVSVAPGVYVPRPQTELLARAAADRLPPEGLACDACCGSGAIALALLAAHPGATVLGLDLDERAVACARANGVDAHRSDLLAALPQALHGRLDVVVASVPYVPTDHLALLPRDTLAFEASWLTVGPTALDLLRRRDGGGRCPATSGWLVVSSAATRQPRSPTTSPPSTSPHPSSSTTTRATSAASPRARPTWHRSARARSPVLTTSAAGMPGAEVRFDPPKGG
ncbi:MAG: methyltransferase domain-containing protein [Acidimicrobiales bacterium]